MKTILRIGMKWGGGGLAAGLMLWAGADGARAADRNAPPAFMSIGAARGLAEKGAKVTVRGIVHFIVPESMDPGARGPRFMIQNTPAQADRDPATSDGLLVALDGTVFPPNTPETLRTYKPQVGDEIQITGKIEINRGSPRLSLARATQILRRTARPEKELAVIEVAPPDDTADAEKWWAAHDGMMGRIPAGSMVTGPLKGPAGIPRIEFGLVNASHPLLKRSSPYARRVFRDAHPLDNVPEKLVDDGNALRILAVPPPGGANAAPLSMRVFDTLASEVYCGFSYSEDRGVVLLASRPVFKPGADPAANQPPPRVTGAGEIRVATFNIENLFDFTNDPFDFNDFEEPGEKARGYVPSSDAEYRAKIAGLARQITRDLNAPDVLMLQEIEDQDILPVQPGEAFRDDRDGVPDVLADLTAAILREGGPRYTPALDRHGADERGITCGLLWRPDRVRPAARDDADPLLGNDPNRAITLKDHALVVYDPKATPARSLNGAARAHGRIMSRGVQTMIFEPVDAGAPRGKLYVLVNHFKSQPQNFIEQRRGQAEFNADLVRAVLKRDPKACVIVAGDLNTYPRPDDPLPEKPVDTLAPLYDAGLTCLFDTLVARYPTGAYSYIYGGQAQTLDHMFITPALVPRLKDVRIIHINSDYSHPFAEPGRGVSDHDPIIATFAW